MHKNENYSLNTAAKPVMNVLYLSRSELPNKLTSLPANSFDFITLVTGALNTKDKQSLFSNLYECVRILDDGGILFLQGIPKLLPELGVFLEQYLTFKYWFAVKSTTNDKTPIPSVHAGVMLFTKGKGRFNIKRTRLPHQKCKSCGLTLKDWGGKSHLRHPNGYVISDVIKDIPQANNYEQISKPLFDILIEMLDFNPNKDKKTEKLVKIPPRTVKGLIGPIEGLTWRKHALAESHDQYSLPSIPTHISDQQPKHKQPLKSPTIGDNLFNVIHGGDAIEILKQYPDESIDLVFADPPYNLDKRYTVYSDEQADRNYIEWCNSWLAEYIRVLKPTGSLFLLNLPRWALYHADFLNSHLYFQNWIVWDALSEPRGKIMPAHYALLFYTKHPTNFTFNYNAVSPIDAPHYCLRASCIRRRKQIGDNDKIDLNDIWSDVHRIKHRRDRDYHPCQLPEPLLERIIKLSTNPGDIVLDAFGGAGTTPVAALKLERRYVAIDIDPNYLEIMEEKISQIKKLGQLRRQSIKQKSRQITKKELQLALRQLAMELGRLPTPEDLTENSQYNLKLILETFPTWGKALKAAKLEI